jgi:hypothetical protein
VSADLVLETVLTITNKEIAIAAAGGTRRTLTCTAANTNEGWFILSGSGSLTLGAGDRFGRILDGTLSLSGGTAGPKRFVRVNSGGTFTLRNGAELVGKRYNANVNSNITGEGGAVYVASGTFRMEGGEISGNRLYTSTTSGGSNSLGGGVFVTGADAVFVMSGGTISNNTAEASGTGGNNDYAMGGGVYVTGGTFTMTGGTIRDNIADGDPPIYSYGGGVYINGIFRMEGGTISNNTGHGVYVANTATNRFWIKGDALVDPGNPVYLAATSLFIALNGDLTQNPAANITLPSYPAGTQILKYLVGMDGLFTSGDPPNYTRFLINGQPGKIGPDGKLL